MGPKQIYEKEMSAKLNRWDSTIDTVVSRAFTAKTLPDMACDDIIVELYSKELLAWERLQELRRAYGEEWEQMRPRFEAAALELEQALERVCTILDHHPGKQGG